MGYRGRVYGLRNVKSTQPLLRMRPREQLEGNKRFAMPDLGYMALNDAVSEFGSKRGAGFDSKFPRNFPFLASSHSVRYYIHMQFYGFI